MALIKSVSGVRGTIGGNIGKSLTPIDIVNTVTSFIHHTITSKQQKTQKVIIARDARFSSPLISVIVSSTIQSMGINVEDLGLSTTPTLGLAIKNKKAACGIMITASHNPIEWNALKLFNSNGEYINIEEATKIFEFKKFESIKFSYSIGSHTNIGNYIQEHIDSIKNLSIVPLKAIKNKNIKVVVDAVNSSGNIAVIQLLESLGVKVEKAINSEITGFFARNPEPLPNNLTELSENVIKYKCDLGIAVDPDVDRLALVDENGVIIGEEYSLIIASDYVLANEPGNTVSNLSSSSNLKYITEKYGYAYSESAVGELNVIEKMKSTKAVIGGEGNGGIIYPKLNYSRDALMGLVLILSYISKSGKSLSQLKGQYPQLYINKSKIETPNNFNTKELVEKLRKAYYKYPINTIDGIKIYINKSSWIHVRTSNTEKCIRIYAESENKEAATLLVEKVKKEILNN